MKLQDLHEAKALAKYTLRDFRSGDKIIITTKTNRGTERRGAEIRDLNHGGFGFVGFKGARIGDLLPEGQGVFDPAEIGAHPFGIQHVEIVSRKRQYGKIHEATHVSVDPMVRKLRDTIDDVRTNKWSRVTKEFHVQKSYKQVEKVIISIFGEPTKGYAANLASSKPYTMWKLDGFSIYVSNYDQTDLDPITWIGVESRPSALKEAKYHGDHAIVGIIKGIVARNEHADEDVNVYAITADEIDDVVASLTRVFGEPLMHSIHTFYWGVPAKDHEYCYGIDIGYAERDDPPYELSIDGPTYRKHYMNLVNVI